MFGLPFVPSLDMQLAALAWANARALEARKEQWLREAEERTEERRRMTKLVPPVLPRRGRPVSSIVTAGPHKRVAYNFQTDLMECLDCGYGAQLQRELATVDCRRAA